VFAGDAILFVEMRDSIVATGYNQGRLHADALNVLDPNLISHFEVIGFVNKSGIIAFESCTS